MYPLFVGIVLLVKKAAKELEEWHSGVSYRYLIPVTETQLHFVKGRGTGNAELVVFLFAGTDNDVVKSFFFHFSAYYSNSVTRIR